MRAGRIRVLGAVALAIATIVPSAFANRAGALTPPPTPGIPHAASGAHHMRRGPHFLALRTSHRNNATTRVNASRNASGVVVSGGAHLNYYGGHVIQHVKVYAVIWGDGTYLPEARVPAHPGLRQHDG